MESVDEIKRAIFHLPRFEREQIIYWACDLLPMVREPSAAYRGAVRQFLSVEEYLALEEKSPIKHEYVAGEIFSSSESVADFRSIGLSLGLARIYDGVAD